MDFKKVVSERGMLGVKEMVRSYLPEADMSDTRYFIALEDGKVKGCVGLKFRAWYLTEIKHLFVKEEYRNQGVGKFLVTEILKRVESPMRIGTPLACCTIASPNDWSFWIFEGLGFSKRETFVNPDTKHTVYFLTKKLQEVER